jgi:hypothetical protein
MNSLMFNCSKCGSSIKIPAWTKQEKGEITKSIQQNGKPATVELIKRKAGFDLKEAKALATHYNNIGYCNRCNFGELQGENVFCPKCNAFNLNWD